MTDLKFENPVSASGASIAGPTPAISPFPNECIPYAYSDSEIQLARETFGVKLGGRPLRGYSDSGIELDYGNMWGSLLLAIQCDRESGSDLVSQYRVRSYGPPHPRQIITANNIYTVVVLNDLSIKAAEIVKGGPAEKLDVLEALCNEATRLIDYQYPK